MVRKCSFSFRDEEVPRDFRWDRQIWSTEDDSLDFSELQKSGKQRGKGDVFCVEDQHQRTEPQTREAHQKVHRQANSRMSNRRQREL